MSSLQSHAMEYTVKNVAGSVRFANEIGFPYSEKVLTESTDFIWRTFQQNDPADRKDVTRVSLLIDNTDRVAYTSDGEIHVSANYLESFESYEGDVKREFTGVLYHHMTHVWQWNGAGEAPSELIDGIADFVRLKSGYVPDHWVQSGEGVRWDQGYDVTARFLDYCNGLRNGFVAELNRKMRTGYSVDYFVDLLGMSVDQLWEDYKATPAT